MRLNFGLEKEFFGCIKNGWKVVNREGDKLAHVTRNCEKGVQTLYENGNRTLLYNDGSRLWRDINGKVTQNNNGFELYWGKNDFGKYQWHGRGSEMINLRKKPGWTFVPKDGDSMAYVVKTNKAGYKEIVYENGDKYFKLPDGSTAMRDSNDTFKKTNFGYGDLTWKQNPETGKFGWQK